MTDDILFHTVGEGLDAVLMAKVTEENFFDVAEALSASVIEEQDALMRGEIVRGINIPAVSSRAYVGHRIVIDGRGNLRIYTEKQYQDKFGGLENAR